MRKLIAITMMFFTVGFVSAQDKTKNKNAKVSFEVDGVCGMCKKRIEGVAIKTPGVKFAVWDVNTHQLNLILDENKTSVLTVQKNITNAGHDVILKDAKLVAPIEAYNNVNPCCKYRDNEVVKDHQTGKSKH